MKKNSHYKNNADRQSSPQVSSPSEIADREPPTIRQNTSPPLRRIRVIKRQAVAAGLICVAALTAFGFGTDLTNQGFFRELISYLPAFMQPTGNQPVLPTPLTFSRDYIYAGQRLVAIDDLNSRNPPPADLAVWRPSSGAWWILGGLGTQQFHQQWGQNGDVPQSGDFDGDGKTDLAIFRPSTNQWWLLNSATGGYEMITFGASGDKPVCADFDGDGRTDIAVFRPSNSVWYVRRSANAQVEAQPFGLATDIPSPADFDGDGRADLAVWRNSEGAFYMRGSSDGRVSRTDMQITAATPVPADYDGDGRADCALRPNGSPHWLIRESRTGQTTTIAWQAASDVAVQNDFDGDGRVDIAVWRNTDGVWRIRQSSKVGTADELRATQWGTTGDFPIPAYFRR